MRYESKADLLARIESAHADFVLRLEAVPKSRLREEGVWGDGWTVHDLVAHLVEWEQMFLAWYRDGLAGRTPAMPAPGYTWKETPRLNREIRAKYARRSTKSVLAAFAASYDEVLALVKSLRERELLEVGVYAWTKKLPLAAYIGPNTASHYATASKIMKRWTKRSRRDRHGG